MMFARFLCISATVVFLAGCANPYEKFYQSFNVPAGVVAPSTGEPMIGALSGTPDEVRSRMFAQGYVSIGAASFNGAVADQTGLLKQARKLGAAIVLISSNYSRTDTGAIPLTLPNTTTSVTTGTANVYGTGGYARGNYNGVTTTYGTQTTLIPYAVDRFDQQAVFFAALPRKGIGVQFVPLSDVERQEIGTNQALKVTAIRNDSPAFKADVLVGDIILQVDGRVPTLNGFSEQLEPGQPAKLLVLRGSEKKEILVERWEEW